ncbi:WD40/YVTN repeat-like-containing domain, partial [Tanacetum coccineum]
MSSRDQMTVWSKLGRWKQRFALPVVEDMKYGDITDLAVNLNNSLVASASNDYNIRVWRLPDGYPLSVLRGHIGAVTAIAFSPKYPFQLLSIWEANLPMIPAPRLCPKEDCEVEVAVTVDFKALPTYNYYDNIVTCSRDGSAIIWITKSRKSHGKAGRWIRAYHLKVPPPPMPPQPRRGGPRQLLCPTNEIMVRLVHQWLFQKGKKKKTAKNNNLHTMGRRFKDLKINPAACLHILKDGSKAHKTDPNPL